MNRQRLLTTGAAFVAASVLLVGCGGGDDDGDDSGKKVAGADTDSVAPKSPSPSAKPSKPADPDAPDLTLPKDLKIVTDWREPADKEKAAALDDAVKFVIGLNRAITHQDVNDPGYKYYSYPASQAQKMAKSNIQLNIDHDNSVTGTRRLHRETVGAVHAHKSVIVGFCVDDRDFSGKNVKTGKAVGASSAKAAYSKYEFEMVAVKDSAWVAQRLRAEAGAAECA